MLKLIFLLFWVDLAPGYPKIAGVQIFRPLNPPLGAFLSQEAPQTDPAPIFAISDRIFMILRSF